MAIVNGSVQGGSSTANQDVWLADYAVTGWASGATLTGDTLSGTTPSEFDGVAQATVISFWGLDRISRIMVTDGGSDKMGLYDIVSLDASTMELQKVAGFGSDPEVNEYVNLTLGDYATQAQSFVFFPAIPAFSQRGSAAKTTKYESEVARTITVSTIYMQNLAGSMSADGKTYTLSSALPANDGYTPSGNPYIALAGQTDQKQNGVYIQTGSTTLARPAWYDSDVEMNNHHRLIIAEGSKYRNSQWIAKASADTIDPTTATVEYECIQKGLYADDTALTYLFDESSGDVLNRSVHAGSIGMDGVPNNSPERQTGGPSPRTPYCMYFPATAYLEVANPEHFLCDNTSDWSVEAWVKTSGGEVFLMMRDASGTWGTSARRMYVASNNFHFDVYGVSTFTFTHGSLCNGDWHKVQFYHRLRDASGNGILSLVVGGEFVDEQTCALGTSNTGHTVRVGYAASSAVGYIADLRYRQGAQHV